MAEALVGGLDGLRGLVGGGCGSGVVLADLADFLKRLLDAVELLELGLRFLREDGDFGGDGARRGDCLFEVLADFQAERTDAGGFAEDEIDLVFGLAGGFRRAE